MKSHPTTSFASESHPFAEWPECEEGAGLLRVNEPAESQNNEHVAWKSIEMNAPFVLPNILIQLLHKKIDVEGAVDCIKLSNLLRNPAHIFAKEH